MATAAGVALAGGTPTRSRGAGGMTAASRPLSLRVEGVPQRLPNRLLVDLKCGTDCPKAHPQPPQPTASPAIRWNPNASRVNTANSNSTSPTVRIGRDRVRGSFAAPERGRSPFAGNSLPFAPSAWPVPPGIWATRKGGSLVSGGRGQDLFGAESLGFIIAFPVGPMHGLPGGQNWSGMK